MFLETKFLPNEIQKKFIDFVLSTDFGWRLLESPIPGGIKHVMAGHIIMDRSENPNFYGKIVSEYYSQVLDIFNTICEQNNINVKNIYRMGINSTTHQPDQYGDVHTDHNFKHNNFILYLNDFTDGSTYLYDDNDNLTKEIKAEKNKAVFFQGRHGQGFCKPYERRILLVITYGE
jgi:hypothetical protein